MLVRYRWCWLLSLSVLGCGPRSESVAPPSTGAPTSPAASAEAVADIPLEVKSWDELQAWVQEQQGKIVVVDVWSTSCVECIREFPHFVEMHQRYGDQVAFASLNVDFYGGEGNSPEDARSKIEKFLRSQQATMNNFISSDPDEQVFQKLDVASIPAALVYDREGNLHRRFTNDQQEYGAEGFQYQEDIQPLLDELLSSSATL